jgi:hypothetical protein
MRGERQLLRLGDYLLLRACVRLPSDIQADRYREWAAELPAILHDPQVPFSGRRALRMLRYAADTYRATTVAPTLWTGLLWSPALLMGVYLALFFVSVSPWLTLGNGTARVSVVQIIAAPVLAVLALRGSRVARVLMITYSLVGVWAALSANPSMWSAGAAALRFGLLACCLTQVCLLVSTPVYQRTRSGRSAEHRRLAGFLFAPPIWMVLVSVAAGIAVTLLPVAGLRTVSCGSGHPAAGWGACLAQGTGTPFAYSYDSGILQMSHDKVHWLFVAAPHAIQAAAFTTDCALWSVGIFLALYLLWLAIRRDDLIARTRPAAQRSL